MSVRSAAGREMWEYLLVVVVLAGVTAAGVAFPVLSGLSAGLLYLLAIILMSLRVGRWPMLAAGLLSSLVWDYIFVEPRYHLRVQGIPEGLMVAIYLVVALVAGQLADRIRQQARQQQRSEESDRLHRTLLDSVSHELRTPLAVVGAALERLEDGAPAATVAPEMRTALARLNRLVGNLLDQTRLDSGSLQPHLDWCDAADIFGAALAGLGDAPRAHPVRIVIPDDFPPLRADFALTEHALANLLLNAVQHSPPGSPIELEAGLSPSSRRTHLSVADRGSGVPEPARRRLFQKFSRAEGSRPGGLGLGLSIARGFIAAQGGELLYHERAGGGAVFTICLPLHLPQPEPE